MTANVNLLAAIEEAQLYLGELAAPSNEANTCDWVVRPLLVALGYANHEIHAQSADISSKFPDYTIMPGTEATWFLEAKAWSVGLESSHVDQAMNYAHSNGRRWVVLSNGREWRLYDDTILGISANRLVATARLDDTQGMIRFLSALDRESMIANKVSDFAAERRLKDFLTDAIKDPTSAAISGLLRVVRLALPGVPVTSETIVSILNASNSPAPTQHVPAVLPSPEIDSAQAASVNSGEVFFCKGPSASASGRFKDGGMVVLAGSRSRKNAAASSRANIDTIAARLLSQGVIVVDGEQYVFQTDHFFKTPSGAAIFVLGRSANGWVEWALPNGTTVETCHRAK